MPTSLGDINHNKIFERIKNERDKTLLIRLQDKVKILEEANALLTAKAGLSREQVDTDELKPLIELIVRSGIRIPEEVESILLAWQEREADRIEETYFRGERKGRAGTRGSNQG